MSTITGVVKWFDTEKGYGFISCDKGNDKDLHEDENVIFDIENGENGPMAINVQKL